MIFVGIDWAEAQLSASSVLTDSWPPEPRRATGEPSPRSWGDVMRTLRLSLAGAVPVALLGGTGSAVIAQDAPEASASDGSTLLDFTMPYLPMTGVPQVAIGEARMLYRGEALEQAIDSGDPRISGTLRVSMDYDTHADSLGNVTVGTVRIDNPDGTWRGTSLGFSEPYWSRRHHQYVLTGHGAYDGLSAILFLIDNGSSFDVEGIVFPGGLPPFPEPPAEYPLVPPRLLAALSGCRRATCEVGGREAGLLLVPQQPLQ